VNQPSSRLPAADRGIGALLLIVGILAVTAAPIVALPWALEEGCLSLRFLLFALTTAGAEWLGIGAVRSVAARLRRP
jgi:hypothetical protein